MSDITLVIGGARSGKSRYAEQLGAGQGRVVYVATAEAKDNEMADRIRRHRADRPAGWATVEEPLDVASAIRAASQADVVIVDCLTLLVTNLLLKYENPCDPIAAERIDQAVRDAVTAAKVSQAHVVFVANEVGLGIVPDNTLSRVFRDVAGRANQTVAAVADRVVLTVAGIPLTVKAP